jgi:hypothetical protein
MSILISLSEEQAGSTTHASAITKLYSVPFINKTRQYPADTTKTVLHLDGKGGVDERLVSETSTVVNNLVNGGYVDFMLVLTVKAVSGNINDSYPYSMSVKASAVVEIYADPNDANDSIVRVRDEDKQEDVFYTVDETLAVITGLSPEATVGFTRFSRIFTQAEVRTLNSANGGYGPEILADPGINGAYQIINPVYIWNITAGGRMLGGTIDIYAHDENISYYAQTIRNQIFAAGTLDIDFPALQNNVVTQQGIGGGQPIVLWASIEQTAYSGTLTVEFDYKLIDLSTKI